MKHIVLLALLAAATIAHAANDVRLTAGESTSLQVVAVSAAYSLDPAVADAAYAGGAITIYGKAAGETDIMLVAGATTRALHVIVRPRAGEEARAQRAAAPPSIASVETRYSSSARQVQNTFASSEKRAGRETTIQVVERSERGRATLPSASIQVKTAKREITLLDATVDNSPLTLASTTLRGLHVVSGNWRFHAGVTGPTFYDATLLPSQREMAIGVSRAWPLTRVSSLMSSVYLFPTRNAHDPNRRGAVGSLLYDWTPDERTHLRSELAFSRGFGGALQFERATDAQRVRVDARYQPRDFAAAGPSTLRGFYSDAGYSVTAGRLAANAAVSFNDALFPSFEQRTTAASLDLRYRLAGRLSLLGGVQHGSYRGVVPATERIDSTTIPFGASFDTAHAGVTAIVRANANSARGDQRGWRISGRLSFGSIRASAYLDRERNSPSLQLIVRERPDLALALEQLGLTVDSPAELARLLRDNASLINLGFIEGVTVNLAPRRTQAGLDLVWSGASQQMRFRLLRNEVESVSSRNTTTIAMLTYSRRIFSNTSFEATIAEWRTNAASRPFVDVAVRHQFNGLPHFGGTIVGEVFIDDESAEHGLAGIDVQLDGSVSASTDAKGRFAFKSVAAGSHQVIAHLPSAEAYFTTPSRVDAAPGDVVKIGIAYTPARLSGRVAGDAGGIEGAHVVLARGSERVVATTASDGRYSIATAPGEWSVALELDSLPAGYSAHDAQRAVLLARAKMATVDFAVNANRSISGRAAVAGKIEVKPLGIVVETDADGRFAVRSLPPGRVTLVGGGSASTVDVPAGPAAITDVVIGGRSCSDCGR